VSKSTKFLIMVLYDQFEPREGRYTLWRVTTSSG